MRIRYFLKISSLVTILAGFLTLQAPVPFLFGQDSLPPLEKLYHLELPEDIGTIEQRWRGSKDSMLILIQDSHISLEVQLNISKIITLLVNEYGVDLVNIEGADHEKIDFQELRELEPRDIVEKVSIDFLKESRINGAVYAKINREKDFIQYGTEDKELYLQNYRHYLSVMENNAELLSEIIRLKNNMLKRKEKFISKKLIEFINLEILFRDGDTRLLYYFKRIVKYAKKTQIDLIEYPMVYQLLEIAFQKDQEDKFKTLDNKKLLDELAALGAKIKEELAKTQKAADFVELLDKLLTLEELLRLRILQTDYEIYQEASQDYAETSLSELIHRIFPDWDTSFLKKIPPLLEEADSFYRVAHERSIILFEHSVENMKSENKDYSVTISGGYHTEALVELCRENDISYLRVMPNVTSDEVTVDYEGRMLQLKSELLSDGSNDNQN